MLIIFKEGYYLHQIPGASRYYISRCGALYSEKSKRLLKPTPQTDGYLQTGITMDDGSKERPLLHRLVAQQFIPNPDPERKLFVNHLDFNKKNCRVSNLEWVTTRENESHSRALHPRYQKKRDLPTLSVLYEAPPCNYVAPTFFRFSRV